MAVKKELVDELLKDADPKKVFGSEGLLDEIKKALAERMLNAELDEHLAAQSAEADCAAGAGNHRNGYSKKTVLTELMLVAARLRHIAATKWGKRRYLLMETLLNPAKQEAAA